MNVFPPVGRRISVRWVSSSFKVELNATTTLAALLDKIFDKWGKLIRIDFKLNNGETEAEINTDGDLTTFFKTTCPTIVVESLCKGFSKLEKEEVFSWASINKIIEDDSRFEDIHIDIENEITSKVIEHALEDLHYKNEFYGPITSCLESSVREYISSVLLACARITGNVKLVAELDIAGRKGNGPLDYAILYQNFFLLITEAKKDQLENGIIQNIAQLVASREQFLYDNSSLKRNYMSMAGDIACIPSTGVVSTGKEWVLIRYVLLPKPAVFKSSPMSLPLVNVHGSLAELRQYLLRLLSKLLGAIDLQKKLVDERILAKAQKREEEQKA